MSFFNLYIYKCAYLNVLNELKSCASGMIDINGFGDDQIDEFINDMYVD